MYTPTPIDTTDISLPEELLSLREQIAKNVHEAWAKGRIDDGWSYGEKRDDANKKHPCLVPYDELPESEKDYDRRTAFETLKLVIALGYEIKRTEKNG
ncbi:MAG: Ryanodine receptor Ryr [Clostridia bacterium]|nr:Ryanodine receptor Ryr [Clostridia bacterium]